MNMIDSDGLRETLLAPYASRKFHFIEYVIFTSG